MLKTALAAILIAGFTTDAMATDAPTYDRKIEAAVKKIVAKKVGDIRGPFDAEARAVVATDDAEVATAAASAQLPLVQVALMDVALRPAFLSAVKYHSGRPEPIRRVRRATSFQYF